MDRRWQGRLATLGGLAVIGVVPAACGPAPVSPLPGQWPSQSAPASATPVASVPVTMAPPPAARPPPRRRPPAAPATRSPSASPGLSPACLGRVIYPVDPSGSAPIPRALCMAAGGVLRVHNVGPDEVSAEPPDKVSTVYEAGVVDCRMLRPGSVTVTITRTDSTATIEVVVVE